MEKLPGKPIEPQAAAAKATGYSRRTLLGAGSMSLAWGMASASKALAFQTQAREPVKMVVNKLKDDLYEMDGGGGNTVVYLTSEGAIVIDAKNFGHEFAVPLMEAIKSVTTMPLRYLINTHHHADHIGCNDSFAATSQIIQHANARLNIVNHTETRRPPTPNPPRGVPGHVTFNDEMTVSLGGKQVHARFLGGGHTDNDTIIFFPAERTIHSGDLMKLPSGPLIDYEGGGSIKRYLITLEKLLTFDFDTVVPGHGPVSDKAGLFEWRKHVQKLRDRAAGLIRGGKTEDEVSDVMVEEFGWRKGANDLNHWWTLPGLMKELRKT
jgi:cyclase